MNNELYIVLELATIALRETAAIVIYASEPGLSGSEIEQQAEETTTDIFNQALESAESSDSPVFEDLIAHAVILFHKWMTDQLSK